MVASALSRTFDPTLWAEWDEFFTKSSAKLLITVAFLRGKGRTPRLNCDYSATPIIKEHMGHGCAERSGVWNLPSEQEIAVSSQSLTLLYPHSLKSLLYGHAQG